MIDIYKNLCKSCQEDVLEETAKQVKGEKRIKEIAEKYLEDKIESVDLFYGFQIEPEMIEPFIAWLEVNGILIDVYEEYEDMAEEIELLIETKLCAELQNAILNCREEHEVDLIA